MKDYRDDIYNECENLSYEQQRELLEHMRNKACEFNYHDNDTELSANPIEVLVDCIVDVIEAVVRMCSKNK